ncbi:MAG: hypothetical protein ACMG6H_08450 [Acidobacteriota bacterium]
MISNLQPFMSEDLSKQSEQKTELGLLPRIIAAGWFGLAACIPIAFFLAVFAHGDSSSEHSAMSGMWFFAALPVSIAAFFGFTIGSLVLDSARTRSASRVMLRGMMVSTLSYLGLAVAHVCFAIIFSDDQSRGAQSIQSVVVWMLLIYGVGAIYVGWLVLIAGGMAGLLLFRASLTETLRANLGESRRVNRKTVYAWNVLTALILISFNAVLSLLTKLWS